MRGSQWNRLTPVCHPFQTFRPWGSLLARLHEKHMDHEPHDRLDWVQSALVLLGYAVYDETWSRWPLIHNPKVAVDQTREIVLAETRQASARS
jgi:hypothetical protein